MQITIVGVGLQGGSLGMAIRKAGAASRVVGVDLDPGTLHRACERGAIDEGFLNIDEGIYEAEIVILATPVRSILRILPELVTKISPDTILFDLGSTKKAIISTVAELAGPVRYIGGHPMAGTEHTGIDHGDDQLFNNATFALVPSNPTDEKAIEALSGLVHKIGARPIIISAENHDRIVSMTSHLPYLLAVVLSLAVEKMANRENKTWEFAASGFRDTTRLAGANVRMMTDICLTNKEPILSGVEEIKILLDTLAEHIEKGNELELVRALTQANESRTTLFGERRSD